MKIKIGDVVRYLNSTGGGKIISIIDDKNVEIEDDIGFVLSVRKKDLVVVSREDSDEQDVEEENQQEEAERYVKSNSYNYAERDQWDYLDQKKEEQEHKEPEPKKHDALLAFVQDADPNASDLHLFLINNYKTDLMFSVNLKHEDQYTALENGYLKTGNKVYISTFKRDELVKLSNLNLQLLFTKKALFNLKDPLNYTLKIKAVKFYNDNLFIDNKYFNEPAYFITIFEEKEKTETYETVSKQEIEKIIEKETSKEPDTKPHHRFKKLQESEQLEIDLHINKITNDYKGLSNSEIIGIQLNHFRKTLESALANNLRRIIYIHGIGNGTLKYELRRILDEEYTELEYQDASFKEYGYGATMVMNSGVKY